MIYLPSLLQNGNLSNMSTNHKHKILIETIFIIISIQNRAYD